MDVLEFLRFSNLETSQSDLENILTKGGFSVNRTGQSFGSVPVDVALEQTINTNAKSLLKGIILFAEISAAVNWWVVTASMKSKILNVVLDYADLNISYDISKELRACRAEQSQQSKF